ncbi:hypothetical protein [Streptomyces sp. NPDC058086]|uniref:hypothetical protein n=1 Tax=Streptomyces sp. NPDC058086 TaxID=3346334 RepID=UPI0036EDF80A
MAAACVLVFLLRLDRLEEHRTMLEARLADVVVGLGFSHSLVRAPAAHRAALALRQPHWG